MGEPHPRCCDVYLEIFCLEKVRPLLTRMVCTTAKESGLECACVNNEDFTVLMGWGGGRCH